MSDRAPQAKRKSPGGARLSAIVRHLEAYRRWFALDRRLYRSLDKDAPVSSALAYSRSTQARE